MGDYNHPTFTVPGKTMSSQHDHSHPHHAHGEGAEQHTHKHPTGIWGLFAQIFHLHGYELTPLTLGCAVVDEN